VDNFLKRICRSQVGCVLPKATAEKWKKGYLVLACSDTAIMLISFVLSWIEASGFMATNRCKRKYAQGVPRTDSYMAFSLSPSSEKSLKIGLMHIYGKMLTRKRTLTYLVDNKPKIICQIGIKLQ
jgi:hypothetical protein